MRIGDSTHLLVLQCSDRGLPEPTLEHRFCERRWRFDLAFVKQMLAVEIEGGSWVGGRHISGVGFQNDIMKYNAATILGWSLLRFTPAMVQSGIAIAHIERALSHEEG